MPSRLDPSRWIEPLEPRVLLAAFAPQPSLADGAAESLRAAIIESNTNGEDDTITLVAGTYFLTAGDGFGNTPGDAQLEFDAMLGDLNIREQGTTVTIRGAGKGLTIIDANDIDRIFEITNNVTVVIEDMTLTNGYVDETSGGAISNSGHVTLRNVELTSSRVTPLNNTNAAGGGIYNSNVGTLILDHSDVTHNSSTGVRGAGGIYNTGQLIVTNGSVIAHNLAVYDGGAIRMALGSILIENSTVRDNDSAREGGAIYIADSNEPLVTVIDHSQFYGNVADESGGAIFNNGGVLTITNSTFEDNHSLNTAARGGGAVYSNGDLHIATSSFLHNTADSGGGIYTIGLNNHITITKSLIAYNTVSDDGGGMYNASATLDIQNSTISSNQSRRGGGGLYTTGDATLTNVTITNNRADYTGPINNQYGAGGGLKRGNVPDIFIHNTIIAGNFSGTGSTSFFLSDVNGEFVTGSSNNLLGVNSGKLSENNGNIIIGDDDPGLGPLADNGGRTMTHVLTPSSPARDNGNPAFTPFVDQRGLPMFGIVDIGAYEGQQAFANDWNYQVMEAGMFGSTNAGYGFGYDDLRRNSKDADPLFLGLDIDTGPLVFGGIVNGLVGDRYGAEVTFDLSARLGLEAGFYIDSGDVFTDYNGALSYLVDELGDGEFNVSTVFNVSDGMLGTISPNLGAYLDLVLELDAKIDIVACAVGCIDGSIPFSVDESLEVFSINRQATDDFGAMMYESDGGPMFDEEVRFAKESIFIETNDGTGEKEYKKYAKAREEEKQGAFAEMFAMNDLDRAKTDAQREAAKERVDKAREKQVDAVKEQDEQLKKAKKNKKLGQQGITLDFNKAEGDLLGLEVAVIGEIGKDKVASRQIPLGGFTATVPEIELMQVGGDYLGNISASTDAFRGTPEDELRQLAAIDLDIGGLLGTFAGLPTGKQKVDLGGIASIEAQTISYRVIPQLNVNQEVTSTPYARLVHYDFGREVEVNTGDGYQTVTSITIEPGASFRIRPGDEPLNVTPTLTIANKLRNTFGLDLEINGALEALGLKVDIAGQSIIDVGPLVTHNHAFGEFDLGTIFDRTFDLAVFDSETGERFEDDEGNPIVYRQPLDGFTIMSLNRDGVSPGTAFMPTADADDANAFTFETIDVQNMETPVFLKTLLVHTGDMTIADEVIYQISGNATSSIYIIEPGLTVEAVAPDATVEVIPMGDATEYRFSPGVTQFRVTGYADADVTYSTIGFMFDTTGDTNITSSRSDFSPLMDVPDNFVGIEEIDMTGVDANSPDVFLQTITIDVDGDGVASPLRDGVLMMRYLDGMRGDALIAGLIGDDATRTTAGEIEAFIAAELEAILDVDDDGQTSAASDGVLITRHLAGFSDDALIEGAASPAGQRTDPAAIDAFLRGEKNTASNDAVMSILRDDDGNLMMEVPGGAGFRVTEIVSTRGGDPLGVSGETQADDNAAAGSTVAKPVTAAPAPAAGAAATSALTGFTLADAGDVMSYDLTLFGQSVTYTDMFTADASEPDNASLWTPLGSMAAGGPMPFADLGIDITDRDAVMEASALMRKQSRTSVLGVDEPIFIEVPDAAGYEYAAIDGFTFDSIQIDPTFGGNLLIDKRFDLYLEGDQGAWHYAGEVTAGTPFMFDQPVSAFRLYGLELPNAQLHRAANDAAVEVITTTGFTLDDAAATADTPTVMLTQLSSRNQLTTPEDFLIRAICEGTCGNAFGQDATLTLVRNGSNAELYLNDEDEPRLVYQLASSTDMTVIGDEYGDDLVLDLSGGPLRAPIVFNAGNGQHPLFGSESQDTVTIQGSGATLDLIDYDVFIGVEVIDMMGDGSNMIIADVASLQAIGSAGGQLKLLGDADDVVDIGGGWTNTGTTGDGMDIWENDDFTLIAAGALGAQIAGGGAALASTSQTVSDAPVVSVVRADQFAQPADAAVLSAASVVSLPQPYIDAAPMTRVETVPLAEAANHSEGDNAQFVVPDLLGINTAPGNRFDVGIRYYSEPTTATTGVSVRVHFDSTKFHLDDVIDLAEEGQFIYQVAEEGAFGIADDDPETDMYVNLLWLDIDGEWPTPNSTSLARLTFTTIADSASESAINITGGDPAPGFDAVHTENVPIYVLDEMPALSVSDAEVIEGDEGETFLRFTVSIPQQVPALLSFRYRFEDVTATAPEDYSRISGQSIISNGVQAIISTRVFGDRRYEPDETVRFILTDVTNAIIDVGEATGTIINDDLIRPIVTVASGDDPIEEDDDGAIFTLNRDNASKVVTVFYAVDGASTAVAGEDFQPLDGSVTFAAGELSKSIPIQLIDDDLMEDLESIVIAILEDDFYEVALGGGSTTIEIAANDFPTPSITIGDVTVDEDSGQAVATVSLSSAFNETVTVDWATQNNTARDGDDFVAGSGTVTFQPGETSATIAVALIDNDYAEPTKLFLIHLTDATNAGIGDDYGFVNITNDDSLPGASVHELVVQENEGPAMVEVTLTAPSDDVVTIAWTTVDEFAVAGVDFVASSGVVTFQPGETSAFVSIPLINDDVPELSKSFLVALSDPENAILLIDTETVFLGDDDEEVVLPTLSIGDVTVNEGDGQATFTITLSEVSDEDVTFSITSSGGSALDGFDYDAIGKSSMISAGAMSVTSSASIFDDDEIEGDETFTVTISNPTNATIADGQATATIIDDDEPTPVTLAGFVFRDDDSDGQVDVGEGMQTVGVILYHDVNSNGVRDAGDTIADSTSTDAAGRFEFTVDAGLYIVDINDTLDVLGDLLMTPGAAPQAVQLTSGQSPDDVLIAYREITAGAAVLTTRDGDVIVDTWGYQLQGAGDEGELMLELLQAAERDLLVIDFSATGAEPDAFTSQQIAALQAGPTGRRVVTAYLSIGEASEFRSYWDEDWTTTGSASGALTDMAPDFLGPVNADYPESRKVRYWDDDWQAVLFNDQLDGWLDVIVAQGFDGAYLDIVDAYYFWSQEVDAGDRMPGDPAAGDEMDAAQRMIDLVVDLTAHARETNPSFFVIPQNGEFILDALENIDPVRQAAYLDAIAGIAAEDTYYRGGADENNNFNPDDDKIGVLKSDFVAAGEPVFVVDYVNQEAKIARFIAEAEDDGFIAYPAPTRELDRLLPAEPGPAGPDATIAFDSDMELAAIDVPGATIKKVRVDVSNIGEEAFNEKLTVQYYLSQDSIITPGEDVLVAEKATRFNLRDVGDRKNGKSFNQNISLPTDLAAGTWFLGVMIDTDGDLEETDETNNTVVFADPIEIVMAVGDISDDLRVNNLTLDIAGRDVKFNYKNAGRVDIVRDTGGFNLVGQGSNKKSKLTVVSKQGESTLLDATFLGTMQEVKLKNVLFTGEMTLAQGVKKLTLDDIDGAGNGQASIQIGASADTPWFQLKASSVADLDVFSSLPAKLLKFVEYRNDNGLENVIQIPELLKGEKTFKSKGAAEVSLVETGDDLPNRSLHVNFAAATLKRLAMD